MGEALPLARIHDAILDFLRDREDAVLFGAQAVNAYVDEPRMTQDVDIMSTRADSLAEELRSHLASTFAIAARIREVGSGQGYRIYQLREPRNRHLADIRSVTRLPETQLIAKIRIPLPEELIAQKVIAFTARRGQAKSGTDWRDLAMLLLAFPHLKSPTGVVLDLLRGSSASAGVLSEWQRLVETDIQSPDDSDEF